jgi:hypothetical protein
VKSWMYLLSRSEKDALVVATRGAFPRTLARASDYAISQGVVDGPFPLDGPVEAAVRWLLAFEQLKDQDRFAPMLPCWNHRGYTADDYNQYLWRSEVLDAGMASWGEKWGDQVKLQFRIEKDLRCGRFEDWDTTKGEMSIGHSDHTVYASFSTGLDLTFPWAPLVVDALRDQGVALWFPDPFADDDVVDNCALSVFREADGEWNWGVNVDVESVSDVDGLQEEVMAVLVEELLLLEKVSEVIEEGSTLIMVTAKGWRSPVSDLRKIIKRVGGPLKGLKVDSDVEDNR